MAVLVENPKKKRPDLKSDKVEQAVFQLYRPNTGLQYRHESITELQKKYKKVTSEQAESIWTEQYDASVNTCAHAYWRGTCRNVSMGMECEVNKIAFSAYFKNNFIKF